MELIYTTTISEDLELVTLKFTGSLDLEEGYVKNILSEDSINYEVLGIDSIRFTVEVDSEYLLMFKNTETGNYDSSYLLVNSNSLLCSNRKNRKDVDSLLKVRKIDNTSRVVDCLNRVVLANHRLMKYTKAAEVLTLIPNYCEGDCEC